MWLEEYLQWSVRPGLFEEWCWFMNTERLQLCQGGRGSQGEQSACQGPKKGLTSTLQRDEQGEGRDVQDEQSQGRRVTRGGHRWRKPPDPGGLCCQGERAGG